jgi:hypothetical protein
MADRPSDHLEDRAMNHRITRLVLAAAMLAAAAVIPASVAASGTPVQSRWSASYTVDHDCGVVESTTVTAHETDFFDDGMWVRSLIQFDFKSVYTGPTGATYSTESHQNGIFTPTSGQLNGQGTFLRGAGGPLVMDVGHLVFEIPSGTTLKASAKVIEFGDPDAGAAIDAALCAKLGS